jgi:hypothetical protein
MLPANYNGITGPTSLTASRSAPARSGACCPSACPLLSTRCSAVLPSCRAVQSRQQHQHHRAQRSAGCQEHQWPPILGCTEPSARSPSAAAHEQYSALIHRGMRYMCTSGGVVCNWLVLLACEQVEERNQTVRSHCTLRQGWCSCCPTSDENGLCVSEGVCKPVEVPRVPP